MLRIVDVLTKSGISPPRIGVISPYKHQLGVIASMLNDCGHGTCWLGLHCSHAGSEGEREKERAQFTVSHWVCYQKT